MRRTALVDGDLFLYRVGFGKKDETEEFACAALDETLYRILETIQADTHIIYLSDSDGNFRKKLTDSYKLNRAPKPDHYAGLKQHMLQSWAAEITTGMEADDACSLNSFSKEDEETVIVSIDKDLLQIPGLHYNFVKDLFITITAFQGIYNLYMQMLTGDAVDTIKGVKGIGPKKAAKLLENCTNEQQMYEVVRAAYKDDVDMLLNCQLLWLLSNDRTNLVLKNHYKET